MALPIGVTPILKGEDAKQFFETIVKDLKTPATLTATPKLDQALKKIRKGKEDDKEFALAHSG